MIRTVAGTGRERLVSPDASGGKRHRPMESNDLESRLKRIYASLEMAEETDMAKLKAEIFHDGKRVALHQDFTGGLSNEELENHAHSLIHNIANLRDHLKCWAKKNGKDKSEVDAVFNGSIALQIIQDLSDNDKHGYPPRDGGRSGKSPKIGKITRSLQLSTKPQEGSFVSMTLGPGGIPRISGSGEARAVISAEIRDRDGNVIGDFRLTALEALGVWERLLAEFGVSIGP